MIILCVYPKNRTSDDSIALRHLTDRVNKATDQLEGLIYTAKTKSHKQQQQFKHSADQIDQIHRGLSVLYDEIHNILEEVQNIREEIQKMTDK